MFDGMGLPCFAERARVELRATGEHTRKRELGTPEELTPQEAQIAVLVSRGEANREIAAQLFVSPRTVEYHLGAVAAGASTRELMVWMGHSSSAAALRYQHVMAGRDVTIAAVLDELVQAASTRSQDPAAAGSGTH
jgi:DNA-binding CsgD family transcriptional regulator